MSGKERRRLEVFSQVKDQRLRLVEAARRLKLSYRQARRQWQRYLKKGDAGLVHGLRGRPSNNRQWREEDRRRALSLYREQYGDFGPTIAAQCLAERDGLVVDHETLRRWLVAEGLWRSRRDRSREHRSWREPRHHAGEMVQMDGSDHDWFEGRGGRCVLMVLVDDATGWTWGRFAASETTEAAMAALWSYVDQRGLPQSLYVDRDSIYVVNRPATAQENLENAAAQTQFGRAMVELEVEIIKAHSPQAKGRVERANATLQDRLVKMLRLEKISDVAAANAYLAKSFWPDHNRRFARVAAKPLDLHRPAPAEAELDRVLCLREERTVGNDYCVRWNNRFFQLLGRDANLGLAGRAIGVCVHLDGRIELQGRGRVLQHQELPQRPAQPIRVPPSLAARVRGHRGQAVPAPGHPWREPAVPQAVAAAGVPRRSARPRCARSPSTPGDTGGQTNQGTVLLESK